jgi:hypothetical protein
MNDKRKYSIQYQIKEKGELRPYDCGQDEEIYTEEPTWVPSPGDSVSMMYGEKMRAFIVLTRHFSYTRQHVFANIVMRSAEGNEISERIKE